jgi:DNA-binding transcriptional ArsR family regulator
MTYHMSMDPTAQLAALADPTRRKVFELVRKQPRPVGALADRLPISRPAVSQHLKVLAEAGLVRASTDGARRIYTVNPSGLDKLRRWIEAQWDQVLDSFEEAARNEGGKS